MNDGATTPRLPDSNSMRSCPPPSPEPSGAENHSRTTEASSTHSRTDVWLASRVPLGPDRRRGVLVGEPGEESVEPPEGSPCSPGGARPLRRSQLPRTQLDEVAAPRHAPLAGGPVDLPEQPVIDGNQHLHTPEYIQISAHPADPRPRRSRIRSGNSSSWSRSTILKPEE